MDEKIHKWLYDIKYSIEEIESYFEGEERSFFDYRENRMLKRAIERNLEIIGEAINRIVKRDSLFSKKIPDAKAIVSLRNQVIHSYDGISDENIWSIIIHHLPKLQATVNQLISEFDEL